MDGEQGGGPSSKKLEEREKGQEYDTTGVQKGNQEVGCAPKVFGEVNKAASLCSVYVKFRRRSALICQKKKEKCVKQEPFILAEPFI